MKKLWKKLLAVTTAVMMAITLLPAMANANATDGKGSVTIIKNGEKSDAVSYTHLTLPTKRIV